MSASKYLQDLPDRAARKRAILWHAEVADIPDELVDPIARAMDEARDMGASDNWENGYRSGRGDRREGQQACWSPEAGRLRMRLEAAGVTVRDVVMRGGVVTLTCDRYELERAVTR